MFDHMVKSNNLLHEFKKYEFEDADLDFIKEQIAGPKDCADRKVSFAPFSDVLSVTIGHVTTGVEVLHRLCICLE